MAGGWKEDGGMGDAMEMMMELTFLAPCEIFGAIAFAWPQNGTLVGAQ